MDKILDNLNEQQRRAVTHTEGPLLILAGAGSGKTRVLTHRIAYLITNRAVAPWNILAITFTNKAAAEMRSRLEGLLGERAEDLWARTFHSACVRILRRDIERLGYDKGFTIYDTADQLNLIKECLKDENLSQEKFQPRSVLAWISGQKDALLPPEEGAAQSGFREKTLSSIYGLYQKKLKANNALDFDDLIALTIRLFNENKDILEYYRERFKYILVDEYQDTNKAQYTLVNLLAAKHRNLCVVGDEDQSIYKFRGADIRNILEFENDFADAVTIKLEQNYRSTQNILDAANCVIKNNRGRKGKHLWTDKGSGTKIVKYCGQTEHDEADFVVGEARRLHEAEGFAYSDMAVLYRMNAQSRVIEDRFVKQAVPYRMPASRRFYERKEVKDIIAYLRLITNPNDNASLVRAINSPRRGVGPATLEKIAIAAQNGEKSYFEAIRDDKKAAGLSGATGERVKIFIEMIEGIRENIENMSVSGVISEVIDKSGYLEELFKGPDNIENTSRAENVKELVSAGIEYEKTAEAPQFGEFMDEMSLMSDIDNYDEEQNAVVLMTVHTAKGLEFPLVFICGAEEGVFPGARSFIDNEELEEERRLCYVAITRAKERLYITHTTRRTLFGQTKYNRLSRFVDEIRPELIEDISPPPRYEGALFTREQKPAGAGFASGFTKAPPRPAAPKGGLDYSPGDAVLHSKFGKGMILSAKPVGNDVQLEVAFDSVGTKIMLGLYAKLEKI